MNTLIVVCVLISVLSLSVVLCIKMWGINAVRSFFESGKVKVAIGLISAIAMYYTPDHIDQIIIYALTVLGIPVLTIEEFRKK